MLFDKFRILFLLIICFSCNPFQTDEPPKPVYTKLDSTLFVYDRYVTNFIKSQNLPGAAIAIVAKKQLVYIKGFGFVDTSTKESVGIHTTFRIASLSKGFASVLTGLLVEEEVLNWDDKVIKYLPDFTLKDSVTAKNLTIRHILSHTSGLTPHAYDNLIEANFTFDKIVERLKEVNVHCEVGECYGYQNTVYSLVGEIIKSATGKTYTENLQEKLFNPLGMKDASLNKEDFIASPNFARPHVRKGLEWIPETVRDTYYNVPPAAGINASIYDMAYWLKALLGSDTTVVSPEVIQEVSKPLVKTPREKRQYNWNGRLRAAAYGMGWRIFDYAGHTMIFHGGGVRGFLAHIAFMPEKKVGIVVLQNGRFGNNFVYKFLDMYLGLDKNKNQVKTSLSARDSENLQNSD